MRKFFTALPLAVLIATTGTTSGGLAQQMQGPEGMHKRFEQMDRKMDEASKAGGMDRWHHMNEHMKMMHEQMQAMHGMMGNGMHGMGNMGGGAGRPMASGPHGPGAAMGAGPNQWMRRMEDRMDMMQRMMEQMQKQQELMLKNESEKKN